MLRTGRGRPRDRQGRGKGIDMQIGKASACKICGAEARLNVRFENRATLWWVECCGPMRHRTDDNYSKNAAMFEWEMIRTKAVIMASESEMHGNGFSEKNT